MASDVMTIEETSGYRRELKYDAAVERGMVSAWAANHEYNVMKLMRASARLNDQDRRDLEYAAGHAKWSATFGSLFGGYLAGFSPVRFLTRGLLIRTLSHTMKGTLGLFVGFNLGLQLAQVVTKVPFRNRPECQDAMALMASYPIMSAWERYYAGDHSAVVKIVPEAERDPALVSFAQSAARFEAPAARELGYGQRTGGVGGFNAFVLQKYESLKEYVDKYVDTDAIAARFADSYAVYLSNDYRRPFSDRCASKCKER
ncbi:hypothetical protein V1512DRAFT_226149 [Lipomyces arxii]|uniref:uncharacterized protein n=1 Tax=Lipomyces arxii TaxID=56418 RepID=UPI0034CEC910